MFKFLTRLRKMNNVDELPHELCHQPVLSQSNQMQLIKTSLQVLIPMPSIMKNKGIYISETSIYIDNGVIAFYQPILDQSTRGHGCYERS